VKKARDAELARAQEYQNQAQAIARGEGIELRKRRSNLPLLVMQTALCSGAWLVFF